MIPLFALINVGGKRVFVNIAQIIQIRPCDDGTRVETTGYSFTADDDTFTVMAAIADAKPMSQYIER